MWIAEPMVLKINVASLFRSEATRTIDRFVQTLARKANAAGDSLTKEVNWRVVHVAS